MFTGFQLAISSAKGRVLLGIPGIQGGLIADLGTPESLCPLAKLYTPEGPLALNFSHPPLLPLSCKWV